MARSKKTQDLQGAGEAQQSFDGSGNRSIFKGSAEFFEMVRNHPTKEAILCYVYRLWPIIDRKLSGQANKYIDKLTADTITEDYLLQAHGTGKYRLELFDAGAGKYGNRVAQTKVEFPYDADRPPVLGPQNRELVLGHPQNASFEQALKLRGLLPGSEEDDMNEKNAGAASAVSSLTATVADLAGRLADSPKQAAGELSAISQVITLAEKMAGNRVDPLDQAAKLKELMGGDNTLLKLLLDNQAKMTELLMKNSTPAAAAPAGGGGVLDQLDTLTAVLDRLGGLSSRGGGGGSSWVSDLLKAAPALLGAFSSAMTAAAVMRGGGPAGVAGLPGPGGLPAHLAPMAAAPPAGFDFGFPAAPTMAPAAAPVSAGGFDIEPEAIQMLGLLGLSPARLMEVCNQAVSAFGRNVSGSAFAEALVTLHADGETIYELLRGLGRDKLLAFLSKLPAELAGRQVEVIAWVDDFLAWGDGDGEGSADDGQGVAL